MCQDVEDVVTIRLAVDALDGPLVHVAPDGRPVAVVDELGKIDLAYHGGHDVGVLEVEVVVGAVEVGGHDGDVVGAVLQVVALAHLQSCDLGDGILLVGVFQWRGEEAVLSHGLGGVLRVDARGAEEEELLDAMAIGLADDVALDEHVLHDEVGPVEGVGHDAADEGSGENDGVGALAVEEVADGQLVGEVKLAMGSTYEVVVAACPEVVPDGGTYEPAVACDVNLTILTEHRRVAL